MTPAEEFACKVIDLDFDGVRAALAAGFDVNTPIPGSVPIVEMAQPARNARMLRMLWEAGASPTTPFLQALFAEFARGEDGSAVLHPKREPVGRFLLHRFCGDEEYAVVAATLQVTREGRNYRLCFRVQTDGVCLRSLPDTAELKARPNAEATVTGKGLAPGKLAGKTFTVPRGYDEAREDHAARIYYADHDDLDENEIQVLSNKGKLFRIRWTGTARDVNHYDGTKPRTRVDIDATFTLEEMAG